MSGTSNQEKETTRQLNQQGEFQNALRGGKYNVSNRFDDYSDPFGYEDISSQLDDIFSGQEDIINRNVNEDIATQQQGAASSLASRGIAGGSILSDTQSGIASNINKGKYNALGQLGTAKASSLADLQKYFNQLGMQKTQAATNVDFGNKRNVLSGLQGSYGQSQNLLGGLDDTTAWDDIFSVIKTGAGSAEGISKLITALSDRRFKENIVKVGQKNGINIYEFNYIGGSKRFRGVIADEVPKAVIVIGGISFVDYSKLPEIEFSEV